MASSEINLYEFFATKEGGSLFSGHRFVQWRNVWKMNLERVSGSGNRSKGELKWNVKIG